jgi:hypothetical protein
VVFAGRTVRSVEVVPDPEAEHLLGHFVAVEGKRGVPGNGQAVLKAFGHLPCYVPDGLRRCGT